MEEKLKIILASGSPRRKEILSKVGVEFEVIKSDKEEMVPALEPLELVKELSMQKAVDVASKVNGNALIIGADTIVACGRKVLGKPKDKADAYNMIKLLEGNTHQVYTGVCVYDTGKKECILSLAECTDVEVFPMGEEQIEEYISTKEPYDKAGSYALQGIFSKFVKGIHGDYNNVVGLPMAKLYNELCKQGIDICRISR